MKLSKITILVGCLFVGACVLLADQYGIVTIVPMIVGPGEQGRNPDGSQYIIMTGSDAGNNGITLSGSLVQTPSNGSVISWGWTNGGGASPSSSGGKTEDLTFDSSAWGVSNVCTLTLNHQGSSGEVCSAPSIAISVNILKESLAFNMSSWQSNDANAVQTQLTGTKYGCSYNHYANGNGGGGPPVIGQSTYMMQDGILYGVMPYEYDLTVQPVQCMVTGTFLDLKESVVYTTTGYTNSTSFPITSIEGLEVTGSRSVAYRVNGSPIEDAGGPPPTNPIMYAGDSPGLPTQQFTDILLRHPSITKIVTVMSFQSTPLYQNVPDGTAATQTFTITTTLLSLNAQMFVTNSP